MEPAREELATAIANTHFSKPSCPVFQNVDAQGHSDIDEIKANLISQLTAPVRWTQSVQNMIASGAKEFVECGPGKVLQGLVMKVNRDMTVSGIS
jgi:[acyl-carrier-protein] S-malonyltransferase